MQITTYHLEALKSQLNSHFVFNALNAIQHFIIKEEKELALSYLTKFGRLIRQYLTQFEKDAIPFSKEIEILQLLLDLERMRYQDKFSVEFSYGVTDGVRPESIKIPPLLVPALLEHAVEEVVRLQQKTVIKLDLNAKPNEFIVWMQYCSCNSTNCGNKSQASFMTWESQLDSINESQAIPIKKNTEQRIVSKEITEYFVELIIPAT